jgi:ABC-type Fe3+ transport system permease subunit
MTWILLMWYVPRLARDVPPLQLRLAEPCRFGLGAARWPDALGVLATLAVLFGVPLFSLVWKLGQSGHPSTWSARHAWHQLLNEARVDGDVVCQSVAVAVVSGSLVSGFALVLCWLAEESPWLSRLLIGVIAFAWAVPGPIVGIGEKDAIDWLVRWFPDGWVANALYHGPSPLPLAWAYMVRFTPFAAAILLPVVRLVPREPREAARLEGQGPWREFWTIVWPLTRRAVLLCAMLVAALSLGEVAASTRVETPGWESFAKLLFDRMHYGVDNNVAALSVLLLGAIVSVAIVAALIWRGFFGSKREAPDRVANTRI